MLLAFSSLLILAYLSGALPWSVWLGRLFYRVDVRTLGDGNPGVANAYRLGGWRLGVGVTLLDFLKAFLPVLIARWSLHLPGEQLFWVALMPTLGHAFSIFLGFRGGRAIVTLFGVWSGLTLYEAPLVMGVAAFLSLLIFTNDVYRTLMLPLALIPYLLICGQPAWMLALAAAHLVILIIKTDFFNRSAGLPATSESSPPEP